MNLVVAAAEGVVVEDVDIEDAEEVDMVRILDRCYCIVYYN